MSLSETFELPSQPGLDTPLRLKDAIKLAFPFGGMTVSGLRKERDRGNIRFERMANKDFVTLRAINDMRELCRDQWAKNGTPGIHGLQGDELRLLRALRREHPRADFVFLSEPPTRTRARILKVEGPQIGLLSATARSGLSRVGRSPAVGKFPTMKSETKTKTKIRIGSGRGGAHARPSPRRD
jgi:hypothetical protein